MSQSISWRESWERDHTPDEAVSGAFHQWLRRRSARVQQMVFNIDPKHGRTHPMSNGSMWDHSTKNSSGCVFVCRGLLKLLMLELNSVHCVWPEPVVYSTHTHTHTLLWNDILRRHGTLSVHFIYKNVLKLSVQRLTNEVRQIMHASLALLYPLLCLATFCFCRRWRVQKRKTEGENRFTKE